MASDKNGQTAFQPDSDVHISYEDQQKINKFAKQNAQMDDYKEELNIKENEMKNLEDACEEISWLDNDVKISYHIGDVFMNQDVGKTQECLEALKKKKLSEIYHLEQKCTDLKAVMSDLKTQLYAKFGSHINLEADED